MSRNQPLNTEWKRSANGHLWCRCNGVILVVGESDWGFWASQDGKFLQGPFTSLEDAMEAATGGGDYGN
jgi:hypothetical protein